MHPARITLDKQEEVDGASSLGPETFALGDRGAQKVQSVTAIVAKEKVTGTPVQGWILKVHGLAFKVMEVQGHDPLNTDWFLRGTRTPGSDTV